MLFLSRFGECIARIVARQPACLIAPARIHYRPERERRPAASWASHVYHVHRHSGSQIFPARLNPAPAATIMAATVPHGPRGVYWTSTSAGFAFQCLTRPLHHAESLVQPGFRNGVSPGGDRARESALVDAADETRDLHGRVRLRNDSVNAQL